MRIRIFSGTNSWNPRNSGTQAGNNIAVADQQVNDAFEVWKVDNPGYEVLDMQLNTTLYAVGTEMVVYAVTIAIQYIHPPSESGDEEIDDES